MNEVCTAIFNRPHIGLASDVASFPGNRSVYLKLVWGRRVRAPPTSTLSDPASMHLLHTLRSQQLHQQFCLLLEEVMDPRMYSSLHGSTASAPSMRASEPIALMAPPLGVDDPGNVKVVVRCRAFVKRGMFRKTHFKWADSNWEQRKTRARGA